MALGDGTAALVFVSPSLVMFLDHPNVILPTTFTPTSVAVMGSGPAQSVILVGFGADRGPLGYTLQGADHPLASFSLALGGGVFSKTLPQQILISAPRGNGTELYLDVKADPMSDLLVGPSETHKLTLTR